MTKLKFAFHNFVIAPEKKLLLNISQLY